MKKILFIAFLCLVSIETIAQYNNYVLGRYYGTFIKHWGSGQIIKTCLPGGLDFIPYSICANCVQIIDSTDCRLSPPAWMLNNILNLEVLADTSIAQYGNTTWILGKLYSSDSLFISYKESTLNIWDDFSGFKIYSSVGFSELKKPENQIQISPLPAHEDIYIQSFKTVFKNAPLVYDVNGKLIACSMDKINANTFKLDASNLLSGLYLVRIETNEEVLLRKMLVKH